MIARIDPFDVAFVSMVEDRRQVDTFDRAFAIACKVNRVWRDTVLWGPEVVLLEGLLRRKFTELFGFVFDEMKAAVGRDETKPIDVKRIHRLVESLEDAGTVIAESVRDEISALFDATQAHAIEHAFSQMGKKRVKVKKQAATVYQQQWTNYVKETTMDHLMFMADTYDFSQGAEIARLVKIVEENPRMRSVDRAVLSERIDKAMEKTGGAFGGMSDVVVGRVWNWTVLELAEQRGVTEGQIIAELDDKTCDVCLSLHGKIISMPKSKEKIEGTNEIEDFIKFPTLEEVDNIAPEEIHDKGLSPPFHPHCRCELVMLWGAAQVQEAQQTPAPAAQQVGHDAVQQAVDAILGGGAGMAAPVTVAEATAAPAIPIYDMPAKVTLPGQADKGMGWLWSQDAKKWYWVNADTGETVFLSAEDAVLMKKPPLSILQPHIDAGELKFQWMWDEGKKDWFWLDTKYAKHYYHTVAAETAIPAATAPVMHVNVPVYPSYKEMVDDLLLQGKTQAEVIAATQAAFPIAKGNITPYFVHHAKAKLKKLGKIAIPTNTFAPGGKFATSDEMVKGMLEKKYSTEVIMGELKKWVPNVSDESLKAAVLAHKKALAAEKKLAKTFKKPIPAAAPTPAAPAGEPVIQPKVTPAPQIEPPTPIVPVSETPTPLPKGEWKKAPDSKQLGSNPGGHYIAPDGEKYYAKFYKNTDQAYSEMLSDELAKVMGLETLDARVVTIEGKTALATRWRYTPPTSIKDVDVMSLPSAQKEELVKHYLHASITANWDVVGMEFDNLVRFGNKWVVVDYGGTTVFRAKGAAKSFARDAVPEYFSLRQDNYNSGKIFKALVEDEFRKHPAKYKAFLNMLDEQANSVAFRRFYSNVEGTVPTLFQAGNSVDASVIAARIKIVKQYVNEELAEKVAAGPPKFLTTKGRPITYANPEHQRLFEERMKAYTEDARRWLADGKEFARRKFHSAFQVKAPTVYEAASGWIGSAQGSSQNALKLAFKNLEAPDADMMWPRLKRHGTNREEIERVYAAKKAAFERELIEVRALSQVYMRDVLKKESVLLYRGIGHNDYQKELRAIAKQMKEKGKPLANTGYVVHEQPLVGFSTKLTTAHDFGSNGFIIRHKVPREDIVIHEHLWNKGSYESEHEYIVKSLNNVEVPIGTNISFRTEQGDWLDWVGVMKMVQEGKGVFIIDIDTGKIFFEKT